MNATVPFFKDFERNFIGFDRLWNDLTTLQNNVAKTIPNWPPYNIRKVDEGKYTIEMAVAGFSKADIDIDLSGDTLKISGASHSDDSDYVYKGIAERSFSRSFKLADSVEVKNASLVNGMLKVTLENMSKLIPAKKIDIVDESAAEVSQKQLLTEATKK